MMTEVPIKRIPYTKPSITQLEVQYAADAAQNGWGLHCYDYINLFEEAFRNHLGVKYAIATSSCTGALHMGMHALGIGPGDEVILADTNWIATVAPIVHLGATPVFVDILSDSWCLNPEKVESVITSRTKAIVAVHLYGNLCEMYELLAIGQRHGIPVIEDSAEAIGSIYHGNRAGSMGIFGSFSFHGTKTLTTGEGGMFVTSDSDLYRRVLRLSNHGRDINQEKQFWANEVGFKYKMSNIQAAIGCAQLSRIDELITRKILIMESYKSKLSHIDCVSMNKSSPNHINGSWMPTVVFSEDSLITRDILAAEFGKYDIDARVFFWPLSSLPMFEDAVYNTNSYSICERAINLPSFHDITDSQIKFIVDIISNVALSSCRTQRLI